MPVIVEFSIIPLCGSISVSKFLAPALRELENWKVDYEITPMCTIFEAKSLGEAFEIVNVAHEAVFRTGVKRVVTTVKIDDRRDVERTMEDKVKSLRRAVKGD
jgi:uncharacterized protein (TIGR00106 family)